MAISLYDVSVTNFLQVLGAVDGFLAKARTHFESHAIPLQDIVETRVAEDMLPFAFQIVSVAHHSAGALKGAAAGVFGPPGPVGPLDYDGLQALVKSAIADLKALTPEAVNALEGKDMVFKIGERAMPFTVEGFLQSFSMSNLQFHAATAYGILRGRGVPLGKRDYLGAMRMKV